MLRWKTVNLGLTILGVWYLILPWLATRAMNQSMMIFGFTFVAISLVTARAKPTVFGCLFAMLIGIGYFFGIVGNIGGTILWPLSIGLFVATLVFELGILKFGPTNARAKVLTIVPLAIMGFSILLGLVGYNPLVVFNWNNWMISLNYLCIMLFSWIYILDNAGYQPFHKRTAFIMNALALTAVGLSVVGMAQGSLFAW